MSIGESVTLIPGRRKKLLLIVVVTTFKLIIIAASGSCHWKDVEHLTGVAAIRIVTKDGDELDALCSEGYELRPNLPQCLNGNWTRDQESPCKESERQCGPDEFRCADDQCIKNELECNHRYDCTDGSDEISCEERPSNRTAAPVPVSTTNSVVSTSAAAPNPSTNPKQTQEGNCSCTYNSRDRKLYPVLNGVGLWHGDKVKKGDRVTLRCHDQEKHLVFPNATKISGSLVLTCDVCRTWEDIDLPTCEAVPSVHRCLIEDLIEATPLNLMPNLDGVTEDTVPVGSELPLQCEQGTWLVGDKKATCGPLREWDYGSAKCVPGCHIDVKVVSPNLIIEPVQEYYSFGETIVLSCPFRQELTSNVEMAMCLGSVWSETEFPKCRAMG